MIIGKHSYRAIKTHDTTNGQKLILLSVSAILFISLGLLSGAKVNMKEGTVPQPWLFYTIPVFGTAFVYYLSALLDGKPKIAEPLAWLGRNSLLIMCLHEPIKRIVIKVCSLLTRQETDALRESDLISFFMAIITVAICVPFVIVISKYLPWMIGRKRNSKPSVAAQCLDKSETAETSIYGGK